MAATASQTSAPMPHGDEEALYRAHHKRLVRLIARDVPARPQVIEAPCGFAWAELLARQPERTSIVPGGTKYAGGRAHHSKRARQRRIRDDRNRVGGPTDDGLARRRVCEHARPRDRGARDGAKRSG